MTEDNSVPPTDDGLDDPRNRGVGERQIYTRYSRRQAAVDLLRSYKWPLILLLVIALGLLAWFGAPEIPDLPPEAIAAGGYFLGGAALSILPAMILIRRWESPDGVEIAELDPVTGDHRHMRMGRDLWSDLVVLTPWGSVGDKSDLADCRVNGLSGVEMMDLRIRDDGTPICVATGLGTASSAEIRAYRSAFKYARRRLSKKADEATKLLSNREAIIREIAEEQVHDMISSAEESGLPSGEDIDQRIDDLLSDLDGDEIEDLSPDDLDRVEPLPDRDDRGESNGHSDDEPTVRDLMQ